MNPVAPVTRATRARSGTDGKVVHTIRSIDARAHSLEWRSHLHVVFENTRKLSVHDSLPVCIDHQLQLNQLGHAVAAEFFQHAECQAAGGVDLSRIPQRLRPTERKE